METPAKNSKFPQHYQDIYQFYTTKEYEKCLETLEKVEEFHIEYKILEAACLINSGKDTQTAHKILDNLESEFPNNAFISYSKGLAFYHDQNYSEAKTFFEKARSLDDGPDLDRADILKRKCEMKLNGETESNSSGSSHPRRFGCEICNHFFGKKFNLDRHNRSLHHRQTPDDFPRSSTPTERLKPEPMEEKAIEYAKPAPLKKKRSKPLALSINIAGNKHRAKCPHCKKFFKRSSLARHMIIHTGKKLHECKTCNKSFYQRSDLVRHETIHSDVLAFQCEICQKRFRLKKNLQVHKRRHHFTE